MGLLLFKRGGLDYSGWGMIKQSRESGSGLVEMAEKIYKAALESVEPENLIRKNVERVGRKLFIQGTAYDLDSYKNIYLVAIGKAAPFMGKALAEIFGDTVSGGVIVGLPQSQTSFALDGLTFLPSSHPLPDERSLRAAREILALAEKGGKDDLFFVLISGGGSALVCLPAQGISLEQKRFVTDSLLKAGASIRELNTVRKHLSGIKGGRLAQAVNPATLINLVISDVVHNDLESIASGPTHWDSTTFLDAFQVLEKYGLWDKTPDAVKKWLENGCQDNALETLKRDSPVFERVSTFIIGDNLSALKAAQKEAQLLGFETSILTSSDQGEARESAKSYISLFMDLAQSKGKSSRPLCLIAGGELTVTVKGKGRGGRNSEFVLASLMELEKKPQARETDWLVLSLGTDGIDGPTDAAGAWIMPQVAEGAKRLGLEPEQFLADNDSYTFFKKVGSRIITGPTHTNVMDLRLFLWGSP